MKKNYSDFGVYGYSCSPSESYVKISRQCALLSWCQRDHGTHQEMGFFLWRKPGRYLPKVLEKVEGGFNPLLFRFKGSSVSGGRLDMKKVIPVIVGFLILLCSPNLVLSDCTDFGRVTNWYVDDENTITFYRQNSPAAKIVLQDCTVNSSSNIRFLKTYICDSDSLLVDGEECSIMSLTSASSESF